MSPVKRLLGGKRIADGDLRFEWCDGVVDVVFSNGRRQKVRYEVSSHGGGEQLVLRSTVATAHTCEQIGWEWISEAALLRNRQTEVVGFGFGGRDRLEAVSMHRLETLQPDELRFYLATVAREADRFEYLLTGVDQQ